MKPTQIFVVVPVFNEERYLEAFAESLLPVVKSLPTIKQILLVNDGSRDGTLKLARTLAHRHHNISVETSAINGGKGVAMRRGLETARKQGADAVIFMDGDCQHDPVFLPQFVAALGRQPIVFGYRLLSSDTPWVRRTGNRVASFLMRGLFGIKRKDLLCGFMAWRGELYDTLDWSSDGYGVEAELAAIVGRKHLPFAEVNISTIYLDRVKGVTMKHAFGILLHVPRWYAKDFSPKHLLDPSRHLLKELKSRILRAFDS